MRYILIILVFLSVGANAQMVIKAHANYRPYASSFVGLLDDYPNAAAAYSLRKLDKDYAGSAIRVRRSNDNAESDIGFTSSGDLDTAALKTFVGANSGFVVTWYDQSGGAFNATQSTAANQPRIMNAGVIDRANTKPAVFYDGTNDRFVTNIQTMDLTSGDNLSAFIIVMNTSSSNSDREIINKFNQPLGSPSSTQDGWGFRIRNMKYEMWWNVNAVDNLAIADTTTSANSQRLQSLFANGGSLTTNVNIFGNGTESTYTRTGVNNTLDNTNYVINIGAFLFGGVYYSHWNGTMQEIILYNADKRTDRTGIEGNINTHYSIY